MKKVLKSAHRHVFATSRVMFWFLFGAILGLFFFLSFIFIFYRQTYENKVYPGITVSGVDFSGKTKDDVFTYFEKKNERFVDSEFAITHEGEVVNLTVSELNFGYDSKLLSEQAYSLGRSGSFLSNVYQIVRAYTSGIDLPSSFTLCLIRS